MRLRNAERGRRNQGAALDMVYRSSPGTWSVTGELLVIILRQQAGAGTGPGEHGHTVALDGKVRVSSPDAQTGP